MSLRTQLLQHGRSAVVGWHYLNRSKLSTIVTVFVIAIALALPMGLLETLANIKVLSGNVQKNYSLSLFLKKSANVQQIEELMQRLREHPAIANIEKITPAQGLASLQQTDIKKSIQFLPENPLPTVLVIYPTLMASPLEPFQQLGDLLSQDEIVDSIQYDKDWLERLNSLLSLGQRIFFILLIIFSLGVTLIIGNTIRLITQTLSQEINVMFLLGGTPQFIRQPFLYAGIYYGGLGAILALALLKFSGMFIARPFYQLLSQYDIIVNLPSYSGQKILALFMIGVFLGFLGARLAVRRELRRQVVA